MMDIFSVKCQAVTEYSKDRRFSVRFETLRISMLIRGDAGNQGPGPFVSFVLHAASKIL
jgi:hypothetical protein